MDSKQTVVDQATALRNLANKLTLKARDHAADAKRRGADDPQSEYLRGLAEAYYKSALDLAEVLKTTTAAPAGNASASAASTPRAAEGSSTQPAYESLPIGDVIRLLNYVDVNPREVRPNPDNTYTGIFSRWEPMSEPERLEKMRSADMRLVILGHGKVKDTNDPVVHFAFKK
jgi:hypothetical protein